MRPRQVPIIMLLLLIVGALVGYMGGPLLARGDDAVRLAERVWREDSEQLSEWTLESEAFRKTGESRESLYGRAAAAERRYVVAGTLFGAWCGLVVGLKLFYAARVDRHEDYRVDQAACVACCRCFLSCPREQLRLKRVRGEAPSDAVAPTSKGQA